MIAVTEYQQGSPEWFAARAGRPSVSQFDKIITTRGEPSKQREKYLYQLAGERLLGKKEETYSSAAMQRGVELEGEARNLYSFIAEVEVEQVALCYRDVARKFSCSPDGLVGETGGVEIKCPLLSTHISYLIGGALPTDYYQQVQGSLFITGRDWWDFVSYYPGIRPLIVRVEPDFKFHKRLEEELARFCEDLDRIIQTLRGK